MMRPWVAGAYDQNGDTNPIHALERGECTTEEFERLLAARIARRDGGQVMAEGLLARMFAGSTWPSRCTGRSRRTCRRPAHRAAVQFLGQADYPRHLFPGMFDAVVISGEVGMRKPEERIFRHAAEPAGAGPG